MEKGTKESAIPKEVVDVLIQDYNKKHSEYFEAFGKEKSVEASRIYLEKMRMVTRFIKDLNKLKAWNSYVNNIEADKKS